MKKWMLFLCMILALLLASCNSEPPIETLHTDLPPATGAPALQSQEEEPAPVPTAPVPTAPAPRVTETEPQPTEPPADPEVELFQELLGSPLSWYNMALTSTYESAADVDLAALFYIGFNDENQNATDAEAAYLDSVMRENWAQMDLIRLPADKMDDILWTYFGIRLADTNDVGLDELVYWPETDAYYCVHTDTSCVEIEVTKVLHTDEGNIQVFYRNNDTEDHLVATLRLTKKGYQILSNLPVA